MFLYEVKLDNVTYNQEYLFNNIFDSFLYSNPKNLIEILFVRVFFTRLFDVSKYFIDSYKNIKVFFVRINSNKLTTKFFFYCFLPFYFVANISVSVSISINFYCKLIKYKSWSYNLKRYIEFGYVCMSLHNLVQARSQEFLRAGEVSAN